MSFIIHLEKPRILYFAIPKAGNTSVKRYLSPLLTGQAPRDYKNIHQEVAWPYVSKRDLRDLNLDSYLVFTVVRNPWERIFSAYKDKVVRKLHKPFADAGITQDTKLMEFVDFVCERDDKELDVHVKSQSSFITTARGQRLVDEIIDISDMNRVHGLVTAHVPGFDYGEVTHSNQNKSVSDDIRTYMSPGDYAARRDISRFNTAIGERFADDVALFGYTSPFAS